MAIISVGVKVNWSSPIYMFWKIWLKSDLLVLLFISAKFLFLCVFLFLLLYTRARRRCWMLSTYCSLSQNLCCSYFFDIEGAWWIQASTTKKYPKRKLLLRSDSEQSASEGSVVMSITLPTRKKLRTIKAKVPKKKFLSIYFFSIINLSISYWWFPNHSRVHVFWTITNTTHFSTVSFVVPSRDGTSSNILFTPKPKGVVIRDPLPKSTPSKLLRLDVGENNK